MLETLQIDWLSAHVGTPLKDIPENMGDYQVEKLSYGTRQFKNLYNIYESNQHLATVVTHPVSQILQHDSAIVKLSNSLLYTENAGNILKALCHRLKFQFRGISRLDIAHDNVMLYGGLKHENLIKGYFNAKYVKTGKTKFKAIGHQDHGIHYDYLRFGSNQSDVAAYIYNKSLEMREVKHKPYITESWIRDEWDTIADVWRIEFSIKSHRDAYASDATGILYTMKDLDILCEDGIQTMFYTMLSKHLHFKHNEVGQRQDRMKDVRLVSDAVKNTIRIPPNRLKDSTKTDKIIIRKISELQAELRGLNMDLAIQCNEVLNYIILSRGLHRWAKEKIPNYSESGKIQALTAQMLFSIASTELHKEGIKDFS